MSIPVDRVGNMPTDLLGREYETFHAPEPLISHGPARIIAMSIKRVVLGKQRALLILQVRSASTVVVY